MIQVQRKTEGGSSAENLLIWHDTSNDNNQVISTGSASPPKFYMKLRTDVPAEGDGGKEGCRDGKDGSRFGDRIQDKIRGSEYVRFPGHEKPQREIYTRLTEREGVVISEKFQAGSFTLEEVKAPRGYTLTKEKLEFTVDGKSGAITVVCEKQASEGRYNHNEDGRVHAWGKQRLHKR